VGGALVSVELFVGSLSTWSTVCMYFEASNSSDGRAGIKVQARDDFVPVASSA